MPTVSGENEPSQELFVGLCHICKEGVLKSQLLYKNREVYHSQCFFNVYNVSLVEQSKIPSNLEAKDRVELVRLKNQKFRSELDEKHSQKTINKKSASKKVK